MERSTIKAQVHIEYKNLSLNSWVKAHVTHPLFDQLKKLNPNRPHSHGWVDLIRNEDNVFIGTFYPLGFNSELEGKGIGAEVLNRILNKVKNEWKISNVTIFSQGKYLPRLLKDRGFKKVRGKAGHWILNDLQDKDDFETN